MRPPTPEPEPEPEVFLGSEWEGRLRRLHDLWSIEPKPQEALVQLRSELRDRISILSKMYLAYCSVEGHGQKIPQGRSFGVADSSLAAQLKTDGGNATAALENLLVVRVAIDTETEAEADGDIDEDESEEATNTADGAGEFKELHMTALHIGGLQGYLEADADALSALFSSFGQVIAVDIREREEKLNWALVSMLRADDAEYAVRKAKERMCKELQSHGDEFDASAVVVQPFDTRAALGEHQAATSRTNCRTLAGQRRRCFCRFHQLKLFHRACPLRHCCCWAMLLSVVTLFALAASRLPILGTEQTSGHAPMRQQLPRLVLVFCWPTDSIRVRVCVAQRVRVALQPHCKSTISTANPR